LQIFWKIVLSILQPFGRIRSIYQSPTFMFSALKSLIKKTFVSNCGGRGVEIGT
jgi:hypothetical protein